MYLAATHRCVGPRPAPRAYIDKAVDNSGNPPVTDTLLFPGFNPSTISQREWKPADDTGRIKIELSAGLGLELNGLFKYNKLSTIACFSFFPAPMGKAFPIPK